MISQRSIVGSLELNVELKTLERLARTWLEPGKAHFVQYCFINEYNHFTINLTYFIQHVVSKKYGSNFLLI